MRLWLHAADFPAYCDRKLRMVVRLDTVPPAADRPSQPSWWFWLGAMLLALLLGFGLTVWFGGDSVRQRPQQFWGIALGIPLAAWCVLIFVRILAYLLDLSSADGWDRAREADLLARLRRGRRSQQILAISLYSALRDDADEQGLAQNQALLSDVSALKNQPVRGNQGVSCRHSQLLLAPAPNGQPFDGEAMLSRMFHLVLTDLAEVLQVLPTEQPLALLLEIDSALSQSQQNRAWQSAWAASGIRQSTTRVELGGLDAIDHWLDERIDDAALLLVVAVQLAPLQSEDTAEVAVGILLGNRRTQTILRPMAYLHRPEQQRGSSADSLLLATRAALNWVPLEPAALKHVWLSGIETERQSEISTTLLALPSNLKLGQGQHALDASLGHLGSATPWTAIAAAVGAVRAEGAPQLILSGGRAQAGLWSTVITAVPSAE